MIYHTPIYEDPSTIDQFEGANSEWPIHTTCIKGLFEHYLLSVAAACIAGRVCL